MNYDELFNKKIIEVENKNGDIKQITIYKPKYKDKTKKRIYSPLRKKYLDAQPEEIVRQEFICKLINDYGYALEQISEEVKLTTSQRGTGRASADIVVWKSEEEKKKSKTAFLVVELKAGNLKLKVEDCYQGYNYATWSRANLFAISNGKELQVYKTIEDELPLKLQPVNNIPNAKDILDSKKLKDALAQTKEFTGDEFAKLLHKCHNIIRNNDKLSPEASFDEISKILFIKIMYERNADKGAIFSLEEFQRLRDSWREIVKGTDDENSSFMQKRFEQVRNTYKDEGIFDKNEKIKLRERSFEQIIKELQIYNLTSTSADVKGIAFEKFLGRTFRGELGQFFTPRVIVDFIVGILDPKENELICDPCAGSGGFLIKVFETVLKEIEREFIILKKEKQKEIFGENLEKIDNKELQKKYDKFIQKVNKEELKRIENLSRKSIFGTDANPRMARVSKMNMIMHGDGHNGIHHNDGLLNVNGIFRERFDMIVTNPPFGTNLDKKYPTVEEDDKYTNQEMIAKYIKEYGDRYKEEMKQVTDNINKPIRGLFTVGKTSGATEVLFIERCLDLLKAGGRMGIVLPEGVLNSSNLQSARDYFESRAKTILIVSLPQDIFISSGATVKTSLVFFRKFTEEEKKEYETITEEVTTEIETKYSKDVTPIEEKLKLRRKDAPSKEEKKKLRAELKVLKEKIANEIKEQVKNRFDYEIPIADIEQAGITSTGAKGNNQLPELLELYTAYRKKNHLWTKKKVINLLLKFVRSKDVYNLSVAHLMENQFNYNKEYKLVRIGEFLTRNRNRITIQDNIEYKRVTIRMKNKGIALRDRVMGKDIGTKKQFLIKKGQFLLSKIDARNGAFGLATDEVDGAIITADFFAYEIDKSKIEPYFLVLLTTTKQFQKFAQGASSGTTGRQRINEKSFLDVKIPLPPLTKQRGIVEDYQSKIDLAIGQESKMKEKELEIENYFINELGVTKEKKSKDVSLLKFTSFINLKRWTVKDLVNSDEYKSNLFNTVLFSSVIEGKPKYGSNSKGIKKVTDTRYIRITDINEDGSLNKDIVSAEKVEEQYILKKDDFLIARSGNTVGKTFLYNEGYGRCLYAGYLIKFILNKKIINPLFLLFYSKSFLYKQWIKNNLRVAGQPNINSQEYLNSPIILPPLEIQNKIANHTQAIKNEIKELKKKAENNRVLALSQFEKEIFSEA